MKTKSDDVSFNVMKKQSIWWMKAMHGTTFFLLRKYYNAVIMPFWLSKIWIYLHHSGQTRTFFLNIKVMRSNTISAFQFVAKAIVHHMISEFHSYYLAFMTKSEWAEFVCWRSDYCALKWLRRTLKWSEKKLSHWFDENLICYSMLQQ